MTNDAEAKLAKIKKIINHPFYKVSLSSREELIVNDIVSGKMADKISKETGIPLRTVYYSLGVALSKISSHYGKQISKDDLNPFVLEMIEEVINGKND